ncbi:MAG: hypothetical protein GY874_06625 [Desulfobacteraceae bacterium]|nr:hypothetical protein [Desulfobacteraceae bacterium]
MVTGLVLFGCDRPKPETPESQLAFLESELKKIKNENTKLKKENKDIQNSLEQLSSQYVNLKIKNKELRAWSGELAKRLGPYIWYYSQYDKPLPHESISNPNPGKMIEKLNALFKISKSPEVILLKIEQNTAHVKVSDQEQLTQRMGSSGAAGYINSVAYSLCSLKEIECVYFDIEQGDHAFPGTYCLWGPSY